MGVVVYKTEQIYVNLTQFEISNRSPFHKVESPKIGSKNISLSLDNIHILGGISGIHVYSEGFISSFVSNCPKMTDSIEEGLNRTRAAFQLFSENKKLNCPPRGVLMTLSLR